MSNLVENWVIETEKQAMLELENSYSGALLALMERAQLYEAWARAASLMGDRGYELTGRGLSWAQTQSVAGWLGDQSTRWSDDAVLCLKAVERVTEARRIVRSGGRRDGTE